jgi:hypothetical protein
MTGRTGINTVLALAALFAIVYVLCSGGVEPEDPENYFYSPYMTPEAKTEHTRRALNMLRQQSALITLNRNGRLVEYGMLGRSVVEKIKRTQRTRWKVFKWLVCHLDANKLASVDEVRGCMPNSMHVSIGSSLEQCELLFTDEEIRTLAGFETVQKKLRGAYSVHSAGDVPLI